MHDNWCWAGPSGCDWVNVVSATVVTEMLQVFDSVLCVDYQTLKYYNYYLLC